MNPIERILTSLPLNALNSYIEMGNEAIKHGNEEESLKWYSKGLSIARELRNKEKESYISSLIITMI